MDHNDTVTLYLPKTVRNPLYFVILYTKLTIIVIDIFLNLRIIEALKASPPVNSFNSWRPFHITGQFLISGQCMARLVLGICQVVSNKWATPV